MKCNVTTLRAARGRRALTQEMLAAQARIDVRTVQRAEAGEPLRQETIADLAAVLGVPSTALVVLDDRGGSPGEPPQIGQIWGTGLILKRVSSGRDAITTLETSELVQLECEVDPTDENLGTLTEAVRFIESLIVDPWNWDDPPCLQFSSLVDRLQAISNFNGHLVALEGAGLALYSGSTIERALVPRRNSDGEIYVRDGQPPVIVRATRLLIAEYGSERVTVQRATKWPLEIVSSDDDDDSDVPF
jgi:transcriptional regulator with XRE-family HTH domain